MAEEASQLEIYRAKAIGTNVNAVSLLATDYLNHFNEALMLAELVIDMPDMLEDFTNWSPRHYKDHFRASGIADKELAIKAYDVSPQEYRAPFDGTVAKLNKQMQFLQKKLANEQALIPTEENSLFITAKCTLIRGLIDTAGAIINGNISASRNPAAGDESLSNKSTETANKPSDIIEVSDGELLDQSDIDALFD
ncbi:MAG: hypothetical protein V7750_07185 [Sneathiella sp.]